ncbi:MAG: hypothetical protein V3W37_07705 [Candidatus Binatia bacterium]
MTLTIEQRWKDVGMDRETVAETIHGKLQSLLDTCPSWEEIDSTQQSITCFQADALLPLIEKAVRKAKLSEALLWATRMSCGEEGDKRIAELEAGE